MKALITGFNPFGGESINPAFEAVKRLPDHIEGCQIIKLEIPTVFDKSLKAIQKVVEEEQPDIILSIGQAGGRSRISVERVAININDAGIEDNEGNKPIDEPIDEKGPAAYFSNLPVKAMVKAMEEESIPAHLSNTAGTYVCNHVMYGVLHMLKQKNLKARGGFIHVPFLPEQVLGKPHPSMSLEYIIKGLEVSIRAILDHDEDLKCAYGQTH